MKGHVGVYWFIQQAQIRSIINYKDSILSKVFQGGIGTNHSSEENMMEY